MNCGQLTDLFHSKHKTYNIYIKLKALKMKSRYLHGFTFQFQISASLLLPFTWSIHLALRAAVPKKDDTHIQL